MNFFKSVFVEEITPPESPTKDSQAYGEDSTPSTSMDSIWSFGGLIKTLASKSESVMETYRHDIQELGTGLRKESSIIRDVASRAVKDLPSSLEVGASVAQESLESVGQAIDDIGSTVWESTARLIFGKGDPFSDSVSNTANLVRHCSSDVKYSRFDAQLLGIQGNLGTYCDEPEDKVDYDNWKLKNWVVDGSRKEEIDCVFRESEAVREAYNEAVPSIVDSETFWRRYFYRVDKLKKAEAARTLLVKKAMRSGEEEDEISWDWDEEGDGKPIPADKNSEHNEEKLKEDCLTEETSEEKAVVVEGKEKANDYNSESSKESDISIISNQSGLADAEDLGWDEINYSETNEEKKGESAGRRGTDCSTIRTGLHKHLDTTEDLSWDIEDEDE